MSILSLWPCMCASAALLECFSGGDVYPCQAYDRILVTDRAIERISIMEYLVNISKRHAFWSLNEDILKITLLTTNTTEDQYAVLKIYKVNILEDIKRGPYSKETPAYAPFQDIGYAIVSLVGPVGDPWDQRLGFNKITIALIPKIDYNQQIRMLYADALIVTELMCLDLRKKSRFSTMGSALCFLGEYVNFALWEVKERLKRTDRIEDIFI
ncbi:hypothetical protein Tco_0344485 [Tanacetum coccineum]